MTRRRSSFDLEAQGTPPARLRRQLRLRALVVAGGRGRSAGSLTGFVLSLLVVRFVELTANATAPEPPLAVSLDWLVVAASALVAVALGAVLVGLATGRAFREPRACPLRRDAMSVAVETRDLFRVHSTPEGDAAALQGLTLTSPRARS